MLLALACFALAFPVGVLLRRRTAALQPFAEVEDPFGVEEPHDISCGDHRHVHGPECGHPAVPHGDHVDYVHDGHRHAPHGEHYDEH